MFVYLNFNLGNIKLQILHYAQTIEANVME